MDRTQDLLIVWSGGAAGTVEVDLSAQSNMSLSCRFAGDGHTGTIPSAALSLLPAGGAGLVVKNTATSTFQSGVWTLLFSLEVAPEYELEGTLL